MPTNPFDVFIIHCRLTRIFVDEKFINYEVGISSKSECDENIKMANKIISDNDLPLKAEMTGLLFKHLLHITLKEILCL